MKTQGLLWRVLGAGAFALGLCLALVSSADAAAVPLSDTFVKSATGDVQFSNFMFEPVYGSGYIDELSTHEVKVDVSYSAPIAGCKYQIYKVYRNTRQAYGTSKSMSYFRRNSQGGQCFTTLRGSDRFQARNDDEKFEIEIYAYVGQTISGRSRGTAVIGTFGVDGDAPNVRVADASYSNGQVTVNYTGGDIGPSGVKDVHVRYRERLSSNWLRHTAPYSSNRSVTFPATFADGSYFFYVYGEDYLGHAQQDWRPAGPSLLNETRVGDIYRLEVETAPVQQDPPPQEDPVQDPPPQDPPTQDPPPTENTNNTPPPVDPTPLEDNNRQVAISGYAYLDNNGTTSGLPSISVSLVDGVNGRILERKTTDSRGYFRFEAEPASYRLRVFPMSNDQMSLEEIQITNSDGSSTYARESGTSILYNFTDNRRVLFWYEPVQLVPEQPQEEPPQAELDNPDRVIVDDTQEERTDEIGRLVDETNNNQEDQNEPELERPDLREPLAPRVNTRSRLLNRRTRLNRVRDLEKLLDEEPGPRVNRKTRTRRARTTRTRRTTRTIKSLGAEEADKKTEKETVAPKTTARTPRVRKKLRTRTRTSLAPRSTNIGERTRRTRSVRTTRTRRALGNRTTSRTRVGLPSGQANRIGNLLNRRRTRTSNRTNNALANISSRAAERASERAVFNRDNTSPGNAQDPADLTPPDPETVEELLDQASRDANGKVIVNESSYQQLNDGAYWAAPIDDRTLDGETKELALKRVFLPPLANYETDDAYVSSARIHLPKNVRLADIPKDGQPNYEVIAYYEVNEQRVLNCAHLQQFQHSVLSCRDANPESVDPSKELIIRVDVHVLHPRAEQQDTKIEFRHYPNGVQGALTAFDIAEDVYMYDMNQATQNAAIGSPGHRPGQVGDSYGFVFTTVAPMKFRDVLELTLPENVEFAEDMPFGVNSYRIDTNIRNTDNSTVTLWCDVRNQRRTLYCWAAGGTDVPAGADASVILPEILALSEGELRQGGGTWVLRSGLGTEETADDQVVVRGSIYSPSVRATAEGASFRKISNDQFEFTFETPRGLGDHSAVYLGFPFDQLSVPDGQNVQTTSVGVLDYDCDYTPRSGLDVGYVLCHIRGRKTDRPASYTFQIRNLELIENGAPQVEMRVWDSFGSYNRNTRQNLNSDHGLVINAYLTE